MQPSTILGAFFVLIALTFLIVQAIQIMGRDKSDSASFLSALDPYLLGILGISLVIGIKFFDGSVQSASPFVLWALVIGLNAGIAMYVLGQLEKR